MSDLAMVNVQRTVARLEKAVRTVIEARECVGQNRGRDRELAKQALDEAIDMELVPAVAEAVASALSDLPPTRVVRLSGEILKAIRRVAE